MKEINPDHLIRVFDRLEDDGVRRAFFQLLFRFWRSAQLETTGGPHGNFSDVRVVKNGKNCFAFKGSKKWILCYFRRPALSEGWFDMDEIHRVFPGASETPQNEIQLRVFDERQADVVASFVLSSLES